MVLDGVICSARQYLGDLCPLVPVNAVGAHEDILFRRRPGVFLDRGIQLVVPSAPPHPVGRKEQQKERRAERVRTTTENKTKNSC